MTRHCSCRIVRSQPGLAGDGQSSAGLQASATEAKSTALMTNTITDVLERTGMSFAEFSALNEDVSDLDSGDTVKVVQREVDEI